MEVALCREIRDNWSKNFDERSHRRGRIFHGEKLLWHMVSRGQCSRLQQSHFLLRKPQQWLTMLFSGPDNLQSCHFPLGDLDPRLIHGSLGPPKSPTQTASRSVRAFLQSSWTWPTDRHTHVAILLLLLLLLLLKIVLKVQKYRHTHIEW